MQTLIYQMIKGWKERKLTDKKKKKKLDKNSKELKKEE